MSSNSLLDKFTSTELFWINLYLHSPLPYVKILLEQLNVCDISREICQSSYYIDFHVGKQVPIVDTSYRVPVFIDFCSNATFPFLDKNRRDLFNKSGEIHLLEEPEKSENCFFVKEDAAYYSAIMHYNNGIVCELEIINWNGYHIDQKTPFNSKNFKKIFRYNDNRLYFRVVNNEHFI